jgi:hypothetical protein
MPNIIKSILALTQACIVLGAVSGTTSGFAQSAHDYQEIKHSLMAVKAELAELRNRSFAVGSVQQSFLTEVEFQKQMGSNWVLCDGRSVPGSRWERLGYGSNIPSCTGRFLRSGGGDAAELRHLQDDSTALNGLSFTATTTLTSGMSVTVNGQTSDAQWTGNLFGAINDGVNSTPDAYTGLEAWSKRRVGLDGVYWGRMFGHYHTFSASGSSTGGSWSTSINSTGDRETRPINITVNTFIKIN